MRCVMKYVGLLLLVFFVSVNLRAQNIEDMKFGTSVENNVIVGESKVFPNDVEKVYCWLLVTGGEGKTLTIKWYYENKFLNDVVLELPYNRMRTYAFKTIAGNGGNWRVDVLDESGKTLRSGDFTVSGGSSATGIKSTSGSVSGVADGSMKIADMKFGTGIENNEVVGEATIFSTSTEQVYCWLLVLGGEGQSVTVKWYFNNNLVGEIPLDIRFNRMRTYAYKTIAGMKGEWKVEVVGPSGVVMQTGTFTTN